MNPEFMTEPVTQPNETTDCDINRMADVILYCFFSSLGVATAVIVAITKIDWFYPAIVYGLSLYFARERFGSTSDMRSVSTLEENVPSTARIPGLLITPYEAVGTTHSSKLTGAHSTAPQASTT